MRSKDKEKIMGQSLLRMMRICSKWITSSKFNRNGWCT